MTMTAPGLLALPAVRGNWRATGWIPDTGPDWLAGLRAEHERAVADWRDAASAHTALRENMTSVRAEYVREVASAAASNAEPPVLPARLLPDYERAALQSARDSELAAQAALHELVKRVGSAVGAHRHADEWIASDELQAFADQWTWAPEPEPGPDPEVLEAEVTAAREHVQSLTADANRELRAWRERVADAEAHGLARPAGPDLDGGLMERSNAIERLHLALEAQRKATKFVGLAA